MSKPCPGCGLGFRQGKAATLLTARGALERTTVCNACAARAVAVLAVDDHQDTRRILRPFADHLRKLAKVYDASGEEGRAEGLRQAAGLLEDGRAVEVTNPEVGHIPASRSQNGAGNRVEPAAPPSPAAAPPRARAAKSSPGEDLGPPTRCQHAILSVLAEQSAGMPRAELAILAGYSVESGGFSTALGVLRERGLIGGGGKSLLNATAAGRTCIARYGLLLDVPRGDELVEYWAKRVGTCAGTILQVLAAAHPAELSRTELAQRTGYSAESGGFSTALGKLRSLELVDGTRASDAFMKAIAVPSIATNGTARSSAFAGLLS